LQSTGSEITQKIAQEKLDATGVSQHLIDQQNSERVRQQSLTSQFATRPVIDLTATPNVRSR
jgi:hypothetical protein